MEVYWLEQNASDVPAGDEWLSGAEQARLHQLRVPKRRADWRLGRWTAKCAVSAFLRLARDAGALAELELRPAPSGAPEVFLCGRPAPLKVSLSHSHGTGLCVVTWTLAELGLRPLSALPYSRGSESHLSRARDQAEQRNHAVSGLGCDLEAVEPRSAAFLADYFTGGERMLVEDTPPGGRDRLVTLLWSAKESALKALGCGLRLDTRSVNAVPAGFCDWPGNQWRPLSVTHLDRRTFGGWWRASGELVRTVVAEPPPLQIAPLGIPSLL